MQTFLSILEVILVVVPVLLAVAFTTVAERKTMGSMQRRVGPNAVGAYGLLQAFADALKLLLKEYVAPTQANKILFFLSPILTLIFALLGYGVIAFGPGLTLGDLDLGVLFNLAVSSLSGYGLLLAGWSANSKYAFLGSLRSTAQLISYELILSSSILLVTLITSSLNYAVTVESQKAIYFLIPLFPAFIMFFIGSVAETNRAPFDLAEAESELVSGYMTEHSSVVFVYFFLAEYASILLICILTTLLFLGGYLILGYYDNFILQGLLNSTSLGLKDSIMVYIFIWVRASFPRIRFDQLMSYCWTVLLPIIVALIILVPCFMYYYELFSSFNSFADDKEISNYLERRGQQRMLRGQNISHLTQWYLSEMVKDSNGVEYAKDIEKITDSTKKIICGNLYFFIDGATERVHVLDNWKLYEELGKGVQSIYPFNNSEQRWEITDYNSSNDILSDASRAKLAETGDRFKQINSSSSMLQYIRNWHGKPCIDYNAYPTAHRFK